MTPVEFAKLIEENVITLEAIGYWNRIDPARGQNDPEADIWGEAVRIPSEVIELATQMTQIDLLAQIMADLRDN